MPKKERDLIAILFKTFFKSLMPRKFFGDLKGSDHFGNKYFEIEARGNNIRRERYFEPIGKEDGFDKELPAEWESWLRGRRNQPPTEEEVRRSYQLMAEKKRKAEEIEIKFKGPKEERIATPLAQKGMGSFPEYSEYEKRPGVDPELGSQKQQ